MDDVQDLEDEEEETMRRCRDAGTLTRRSCGQQAGAGVALWEMVVVRRGRRRGGMAGAENAEGLSIASAHDHVHTR